MTGCIGIGGPIAIRIGVIAEWPAPAGTVRANAQSDQLGEKRARSASSRDANSRSRSVSRTSRLLSCTVASERFDDSKIAHHLVLDRPRRQAEVECCVEPAVEPSV